MDTNVVKPQALSNEVIAPKLVFYHQGTTTLSQIHEYVNPVIEALMQEIKQLGLESSGPLEFIYLNATGDLNKEFTLQVAQPVKEQKSAGTDFNYRVTEPFKCVRHDYQGDVSQMMPAYDMLFQQIYSSDLKPNTEVREVYKQWEHLTSPNNITEIQIGVS